MLFSERETNREAKLPDSDSIILTENLKQLCLKEDMFQELDDKIVDKLEDEDKIEVAVNKGTDLQAMLSERMVLIAHILSISSQPHVTDLATATTEGINPPQQIAKT